jgi:hypothetical protein
MVDLSLFLSLYLQQVRQICSVSLSFFTVNFWDGQFEVKESI